MVSEDRTGPTPTQSDAGRPLHVAYVTPYDARDVAQWSGLGHYIGRAIERQGARVDYVGPVDAAVGRLTRTRGIVYRRLLGRGHWPQVEPAELDRVGRAASAKLAGSSADVVLGLAADAVARLRCRQPIVLWTDSPLAGLVDLYDYGSSLSRRTRRQIHAAEAEALGRCAAIVYTSRWAADVAVATYGLPPARVHVVPFGANLDDPPSVEAVATAVAARPMDRCDVLFLGVDWHRKGGPIAVAAVRRLVDHHRLPARLTIAGCDPPADVAALPFVDALGFISKRTADGRRRVAELLAGSHLLLLPTRAEAYGLVFAEASAYGVPSVTTDVGGTGGVVTDGVNGVRLPLDAGADVYADWIADLFADGGRYRRMALTARDQFDRRLNWDAAGTAVTAVLRTVVSGVG